MMRWSVLRLDNQLSDMKFPLMCVSKIIVNAESYSICSASQDLEITSLHFLLASLVADC
jgi:hypothetical protein